MDMAKMIEIRNDDFYGLSYYCEDGLTRLAVYPVSVLITEAAYAVNSVYAASVTQDDDVSELRWLVDQYQGGREVVFEECNECDGKGWYYVTGNSGETDPHTCACCDGARENQISVPRLKE